MRSLLLTVTLVLAGCPGSDDGPTPMPDAAPDASGVIQPIEVTFERVGAQSEVPNAQLRRGPGSTLYSIQSNFVEVSTDAGVTWTRKTQGGVSSLAVTPTALFAHTTGSTQSLLRSTDGANTFTQLTVPGYVPNNNFMRVETAGSSLWVAIINTQLAPIGLYRSADQGASFSPITFPGTFTEITLTGGGEGKLYLVGNDHLYRTVDGAAWEDLGAFPEVMSVFVTQAGTALVYSRDAGRVSLHRRAAADTTWTIDPPEAGVAGQFLPTIVQRPNGELVRFGYPSTIDASATEGASWTSVLATGLQGLSDMFALDSVIIATLFDGAGFQEARFPTGATSWSVPTPTSVPLNAELTDLSFTADGRIVLASRRQIFTSSDSGVTWRRGTYLVDEASPIRTAAVSPDGAQIFVGSTYMRRGFLAGDGNSQTGGFTNSSGAEPETVMGATWANNTHVIVTTANTENTRGTVFDGDTSRVSIWDTLNPFRMESNPQFDPTAGFHGIAACKYADSFALLIGAQQWIGTNAYQPHLLIQYQFNKDGWQTLEPPVAYGQAQSISCTQDGRVALVFRDEFLYVGGWHLGFHEVTGDTVPPMVFKARFAPDGHLWLLGSTGLVRSTAPVVIP